MAELEDLWDQDNSNQIYSRHWCLIVRWFQDIGTYMYVRVKVGRKAEVQK